MATLAQKLILILILMFACTAMGFTVRDFLRGITVECAWGKCKHNKDGICQKYRVRLELYRPDEDHEGLVCDYYEPEPDKPIPNTHIDIRG